MFARRKVTTAAVTLVMAISAGHVMQFGLGAQTPAMARQNAQFVEIRSPLSIRPDALELLEPSRRIADGPTVGTAIVSFPNGPGASVGSLELPKAQIVPVSIPEDTFTGPPGDADTNLNGFGIACDYGVTAEARPGALVALSVNAPCRPNELAEIRHGNLSFSLRTDPTGRIDLLVPALSAEAKIDVAIRGAPALSTETNVPEAESFERVALLWNGGDALSLHARWLGNQDSPGDYISHNSPGDPDDPAGFLVRLGDPDRAGGDVAAVFSYPRNDATEDSDRVRISVSARVTSQNCGSDVGARSFRVSRGVATPVAEYRISVPGCDAVGNILVLKNLLADLKIAQK